MLFTRANKLFREKIYKVSVKKTFWSCPFIFCAEQSNNAAAPVSLSFKLPSRQQLVAQSLYLPRDFWVGFFGLVGCTLLGWLVFQQIFQFVALFAYKCKCSISDPHKNRRVCLRERKREMKGTYGMLIVIFMFQIQQAAVYGTQLHNVSKFVQKVLD